ncbi:hypothetical protein LTR62_005499 [Meristemomyces frigidus]|uniref:RRM domain-containing protein n=1 Tax=Meristemomyces frigidus TaxID=1508187 RepID=A0AAN7TDK2_9PEZI|nr:hypothetical protein LTR62_005499 [Meristemomyces frigidus]
MEELASSRIFIKGLPPTFTEADFRKHFARDGEITDAKIFQNRRIGYVGYRTPEDAQKAVKYFNRTFIRMSRINVEIARPPSQPAKVVTQAPTARRNVDEADESANALKRKRDSETKDEDDPKLKEFLEVFKSKDRKKAWESAGTEVPQAAVDPVVAEEWTGIEDGQSDDEYEVVPKRAKTATSAEGIVAEGTSPAGGQDQAADSGENNSDLVIQDAETSESAINDADWARSRTSRLLGLADDDEEAAQAGGYAITEYSDDEDDNVEDTRSKVSKRQKADIKAASSLPSPPSDKHHDETKDDSTDPTDIVPSSMRLFVRNLPYDLNREDLQAEFESYGDLEEVSDSFSLHPKGSVR